MILSLSGKWKLKNSRYCVDGNVPGDITNDMFSAGIVKNPYYGEEYKNSLWITHEDWVYAREFVCDVLPAADENAFLRFDGIDTFADVYLNGEKAGSACNMHRTYNFPVNGLLKKGKNELTVVMHNVYDKMGKKDQTKYESIFCANRVLLRKAQCHFGWDWAPRFPGYGIYRDAFLVIQKKTAVSYVGVQTELCGNVTFRVELGERYRGNVEIRILHEGKEVARENKQADCKKFLVNLHVPNPQLWWPNGYGEQPIYEYVITQENGEQTRGTFGFRKIELVRNVRDKDNLGFEFRINGREIFCRGSNWVPAECMTGSLKNEKYYALLKAAKDANMNMLRVWGGGIYEKDCFYEYCDKMGIMIWQDFMFACSEIPEDNPDFLREITQEAVGQVKRLGNHPCLTYWCGMNEIRGSFSETVEERYSVFTLHYLLRGITSQFTPDIPYERTSPYSFADTENDACEGDSHNNISEICLFDASFKGFDAFEYADVQADDSLKARIKQYERYLSDTKSNFSSECAVLGMCNYRSLEKFTPREERRVDSPFLKERFLGNPYTYVMPTFFERQNKIAEAMYGKPTDLKDLVKKSNKAQADIMRTEIVYCRVNGRSHGFLNWMYNDIWPTGTWSVIDYYLSKKPAYYEMKRCFAPVMAQIIRIDGKCRLCVVNDTNRDFAVAAQVGTKTYNGTALCASTVSGVVRAGGTFTAPLDCKEEGDYVFASGTVGELPFAETYELSRYREKKFVPEYSVSSVSVGDGKYEITVSAKTFVPCFKISAGDNAQVADNYFDLAAGTKRTVAVQSDAPPDTFRYSSFADVWND